MLITIMIISLLVVVTTQFGQSMRREMVSAANIKDKTVLDAIAGSGVNIAFVLLDMDSKENTFDSYHDIWAKAVGRDFSSMFEQGKLNLAVSDLSGRLQVNSLVSAQEIRKGVDAATAKKTQEILKRLLMSGHFGNIDEIHAMGIVDSLIDWIDKDDRESPYGAEDSYYRSLDHPYGCKNGPVSFIEELLLVKGITREILYGTKEHPGLAQFLTVHGIDGRININTADPVLLQAMDPQMTTELADSMVEFRKKEENVDTLSKNNWYKGISSWPGDVSLPDKLITTKSQYFMITSIGERGSLKEQETTIVHRDQSGKVVLLEKKVE